MESLERARACQALVGARGLLLSGCPDGFSGGGQVASLHAGAKEIRRPGPVQPWTYTKIVPAREIEYLHHFADRDGNRVTPVTLGLPPDMPEEVRNAVTFKAVGNNETEITVTEFDWHAGQMMEMSRMGMEQCLDKMAASLAEI